jgi:sugar/nucleoside kinase (ribokinase family)
MASLAGMIHGYLRDGATLIVRAGEHGCVIVPGTDHTAISTEHPSAGNTPVVIPSRPAREVVDTTGAGDVHTAVYLVSIAYGIPKADAAWIANVAASMSVERKGGASCPSIGELNAYLSTNEI